MRAAVISCLWVLLVSMPVAAADFRYSDVSSLPGGPGQGRAPSLNNRGDVAFYAGTDVFVYDRSEDVFIELTGRPGGPAKGWFPKQNSQGNVALLDPDTRDVWLWERATSAFTNLSALPGWPGNSGANGLRRVFDLGDRNEVSFHSGDLNAGDIWVYDHADGSFTNVSDQPGAPFRGRENAINAKGQVAYMGFPDIWLYDPATGLTTNLTDLPGGPGTGLGSFSLNDRGDIIVVRSDELVYFNAAAQTFLYLSTLPGFPPGNASSDANDLSDRGEITFWRDGQFYFDPTDQGFTRLDGQGAVPVGGLASSINDLGEIAFSAGPSLFEDLWLAEPVPSRVPLLPPAAALGLGLALAALVGWRSRPTGR